MKAWHRSFFHDFTNEDSFFILEGSRKKLLGGGWGGNLEEENYRRFISHLYVRAKEWLFSRV